MSTGGCWPRWQSLIRSRSQRWWKSPGTRCPRPTAQPTRPRPRPGGRRRARQERRVRPRRRAGQGCGGGRCPEDDFPPGRNVGSDRDAGPGRNVGPGSAGMATAAAAGPPGPEAAGEITSIRSPRVKAARQLAKRAFRQRSRAFLAEGPQSVAAALRLPGVLTGLFVTGPASSRYAGLVRQATDQGAAVHTVSGEVMAELAQTVAPQGVLAGCRFLDVPLADLAGASPRLVAVLANVRDPGNAGPGLRAGGRAR